MGQKYLVAGKRVSMRLWSDESGGKLKAPTARDYETVGYVISGRAKLELALNLKAGLLASASRCDARVHNHRALYSCGGDRASRRGPRSRRTLGLNARKLADAAIFGSLADRTFKLGAALFNSAIIRASRLDATRAQNTLDLHRASGPSFMCWSGIGSSHSHSFLCLSSRGIGCPRNGTPQAIRSH